jgi:hypothetical protein
MADRPTASSREELTRLLLDHTIDLQRHGVKSLELFGSLARGEARPDSDVDLLVEFEGAPTFDRFMDLKFFLEDLLVRRVDLVTRAALKPRMRSIVEKESIRVA